MKIKARICVINDNPDIIESIHCVFERFEGDIEVLGYTSPANAMQSMLADPPDLVLLDLMIPGMSGWQITTEMRKDEHLKSVPIIFLTAINDKETERAGKMIAKDYVTKPFTTHELLRKSFTALLPSYLNETG